MNCQPGDLARVISPGLMSRCPMCGKQSLVVPPDRFVRCTELSPSSDPDEPWWSIEEGFAVRIELVCGFTVETMCLSLPDDILRPIRNPGVDEVDEILLRVGAPTYDADPALLGREAAEPSGVRHG